MGQLISKSGCQYIVRSRLGIKTRAPNGFASTCWLSFQRVNLIVDFSVKYVATKFIQYDMFSRCKTSARECCVK